MLPLFSHLNLAVRSLQEEDGQYLSMSPFPLCEIFLWKKKIKSTAINNPVTAATSWRLRECADARQPGLEGGRLPLKTKMQDCFSLCGSSAPSGSLTLGLLL